MSFPEEGFIKFMTGAFFNLYHRTGLYLFHVLECLTTITITDFLYIVIIIDTTTIGEGVLEAGGSEV